MKGKTILFFGALMLLSTAFSFAQSIRKPVWAGQFYDADKAALAARIEGFLASARPAAVPGKIRALIVPHAGYIYSGRTAAFAYRLVQGEDIETVVILGPSHRVGFEGCSIYSEGGFETPLGIAEVDAPTARAIAGASGFGFVPEAHAEEHSVEVQVPFVQKVLPKAKIVPIVMGFPSEPNIRMLAGALAKVLKDRKALVIASTDMSHFLNQKEAEATDKSTLELVQDQKVPTLLRKIERNENVLCGGAAVVTALLYAQKMGSAAVTVLRRADSTEGGAPADSVVGYFSAAVTTRVQTQASNSGGENSSSPPAASARGGPSEFSAGAPAPQAAFVLSADEKKELLRLARQAVDLFVREGKTLDYETKNLNLLSPEGAFVTLKKKGELRGCIGFIEPVYPLYKAVIQCAVYAATEDPRFGPVSTSELKAIEVEISVLTPLKKIDDPDLVRVGKHGLVISSGGRRGLLLPQVPVENNWTGWSSWPRPASRPALPRTPGGRAPRSTSSKPSFLNKWYNSDLKDGHMPIHEYACEKCHKRFEKLQKVSDKPCKKCPSCGGPLRKLISSPAIQFKGNGFYINDYAKKNVPDKDEKSKAKTKPGKSGESKAEAKSAETIPSDKPCSD